MVNGEVSVMNHLCPAPHTIAAVDVEPIQRPDGRADRKVTVTRSCGHPYFWGGWLDQPLPVLGFPAMACLGPQIGDFISHEPSAPTFFDPRKRAMKRKRVA
jgi:hypothetical protein